MLRRIIGVIVGLSVGVVSITVIEILSTVIYPLPAGFDRNDGEALRRHVESLPLGAFLLVLAAHAIGCMLAGFTCAIIVRRPWSTGPLIIGVLFLIGGIMNLATLPHPLWFGVVDVLLYIPCSLLGWWIGQRMGGSPAVP